MGNIIEINYPDLEIVRPTGKYFMEVSTLFIGRYIDSNAEPVRIAQEKYKEWALKQLPQITDIGSHLGQIVADGGVVEGAVFFLRIDKTSFQNMYYPATEQTWKQWSESKPEGARFTNLIVKDQLTHFILRPNHYGGITSEELRIYSQLVYLSLVETF